jgi:sialidase-1
MQVPAVLPRAQLRRDIGLSIVLVVFALLFVVIYVVFLASFGGEFLIVIKGLWILPVFLVLLISNSIASLVLSILSLRTGVFRDFPQWDAWPAGRNKAWLVGWSVWNLVAAIPIVLVGKVLALGALGSVPTFLIALLMLPFVGTAAVFLIGSLGTLVDLVRRREVARLPRGAAGAGLAFLVAFGAFGIIAALWAPRWTEGVEHTPLFVPGEEPGRGYRIPAMVVLPGDVLVAFAESRVNAMSDLLDINLVMKRSLDGGRSWSPLVVLEDQGRHTVHSPCPVFDAEAETVWLPFCVDYQTLYLTSSADAGLSWSEPRNLSEELGLPADTWCHNGPGNGIQMTSGRLVIPTSLNGSRVMFSDDHGRTWKLGAPIGRGEEPQVFERADGALCANLRNERGSSRIVACSLDGGQTWETPVLDDELPDAGTQASILRYSTEASGGQNRLLFSNPGAPYRGELTLRLSYDEGATWPVSRLVYEGAAGYSQLAVLSDGSILMLFEAGRYDLRESITLARVSLGWLTESAKD